LKQVWLFLNVLCITVGSLLKFSQETPLVTAVSRRFTLRPSGLFIAQNTSPSHDFDYP